MLCNIGRVGDTILRNSILDSAFRTYSTVDYICGPGNAELLCHDSRFNRVIVLQNKAASIANLVKVALQHRYDAFIELKDHWSWTSVAVSKLFRCRVKTGWNKDGLRPFDRDVRSVYVPREHKMDTMRRIGKLAGLVQGEYKPSLVLTADSIRWFQANYKWEKPFIFLNISATSPARFWPVTNWVRYMHGCGMGDGKELILVNGLPKDRESVEELCSRLQGALPFKPRQFMDVAAALVNARLVLTVDTGVVHACSALDKPIVTFSTSGTEYGALSTRRLVVQPSTIVAEMDPEWAIAETLRHGLP